ncbi:MAG: hypothetical protein DRM98_00020 [Thermoplasmata archaeon]|nr:MAG: hypothetical protein DRM98_00020 [Thermoplasmata archaeon]
MIELEEKVLKVIVEKLKTVYTTGIITVNDTKYKIKKDGNISITLVLEEDNSVNWYFHPVDSDILIVTEKAELM